MFFSCPSFRGAPLHTYSLHLPLELHPNQSLSKIHSFFPLLVSLSSPIWAIALPNSHDDYSALMSYIFTASWGGLYNFYLPPVSSARKETRTLRVKEAREVTRGGLLLWWLQVFTFIVFLHVFFCYPFLS